MGCNCGGQQANQTFTVTWGDGTKTDYASQPSARIAMGTEKDPAKRRGMRVAVKAGTAKKSL